MPQAVSFAPCDMRSNMNPPPRKRPLVHAQRQRGMATLVVVMILFFIIAMVAAYTSRNMIFEQRASANQYRATQAAEAAEAGLQWALAMLNGGRIDAACQPSAVLADGSFRARYLTVIDTTRGVTVATQGGAAKNPVMPTCVFDPTGNTWACNCPAVGAAVVPPVAASTQAQPFFRVQFTPLPPPPPPAVGVPRADVFMISVVGCTRPDASCLLTDAAGPTAPLGDAIAVARTKVTLRSALATPPGAAITAALNVDGGVGAALTARNDEFSDGQLASTAGVTVIAGGTVSNLVFESLPGTPGSDSVVANDPDLGAALGAVNRAGDTPPHTANDRMFSLVFGMWPETYLQQPSVVVIPCAAGCTSAVVQAQALLFPGHPLWVDGDLVVDADIGSAPAIAAGSKYADQTLLASEAPANGPVLLIVKGNLALTGGVVHGLVYRRATAAAPSPWNPGAGTTVINGALITEGSLLAVGAAAQTVNYNAAVLNRLHTRVGSFVRLPGAWRDF
jgi:Tfp pilus assembly protein PilX